MKVFITSLLLCLVFTGAAFGQADPIGITDTVLLVPTVCSTPGATSRLFLELWVYNDEVLYGATAGFSWDNPKLQMDSAIVSPEAEAGFDLGRFFYESSDLATTNANLRFLFGGATLFSTGIAADPTAPRLWATYYFTATDWTVQDMVTFDTLTYSSGTEFLLISNPGNVSIVPAWAGAVSCGNPPVPTNLRVDQDPLEFTAIEAGTNPDSQVLQVMTDNSPVTFTADKDSAWLNVSPTAGTTPAELMVSVDIDGLTAGVYSDILTLAADSAANSPLMVPVRLTITPSTGCPTEPTCFTFTAETEDFYSIVIDSIDVDGLLPEQCSEIAVFDGDLCVGASVFDGTWPVPITAWADDPLTPDTDGYAIGDPMSFRLGLPETCDKCSDFTVQYSAGDGTFGNGIYTQVAALGFTCGPDCFTFTSGTGDFYPVIVDELQLSSVAFDVGDELGVFDGDLCVGATHIDGNWPLAIEAWVDDTQTLEVDGYTAGDVMSFKFAKSGVCDSIDVCYGEGALIAGDSLFGSGILAHFAYLSEDSCLCEASIAMNSGWNFISICAAPELSGPLDVFSPFISDVNVIKSESQFCVPGVICNIPAIEPCAGYKVHVNTPHTLDLTGDCVDCVLDLPLGWSWIGYCRPCCQNAEVALASINGCFDLIKGSTGFYVPGVINTLADVCPNEGFAIHMTCAATLIYPECGPAPVGRMSPTPIGVGSDRLPVSEDFHPIVILDGGGLTPGEEVRVYTESGMMVGAARYTGQPLGIEAWADNSQTPEHDGWTLGEKMSIRVLDPASGAERSIGYSVVTGSEEFGRSPYTQISLGGAGVVLPSEFSLGQNFPNPFNPTTEIEFSIQSNGHVSLHIYNILGQSIRSLVDEEMTAGTHRVNWDGTDDDGRPAASGIYLYRLTTDNREATRKMMLLR